MFTTATATFLWAARETGRVALNVGLRSIYSPFNYAIIRTYIPFPIASLSCTFQDFYMFSVIPSVIWFSLTSRLRWYNYSLRLLCHCLLCRFCSITPLILDNLMVSSPARKYQTSVFLGMWDIHDIALLFLALIRVRFEHGTDLKEAWCLPWFPCIPKLECCARILIFRVPNTESKKKGFSAKLWSF